MKRFKCYLPSISALAIPIIFFSATASAQSNTEPVVINSNLEKEGAFQPNGGAMTWSDAFVMHTRITITSSSVTIDNATHRVFNVAGEKVTVEDKVTGSNMIKLPITDKNGNKGDLYLSVFKDGTTTLTIAFKKYGLEYPIITQGHEQ